MQKFEAHTKVVENMRTAQEDLRQEQQDLKNHILNLSDLTSQIEEQQNATLVWIKNLLDVRPFMIKNPRPATLVVKGYASLF